jgi:hypothetical protein
VTLARRTTALSHASSVIKSSPRIKPFPAGGAAQALADAGYTPVGKGAA